MPAYKYTLKSGKTLWYANFYYTDWTGEKKHICKRGFKTQREAKDYERSFLDQQNTSSDILFSSLVANYLEDMEHRLKPTTMENKRFIIETKLLPYFGKQKICDIDTIKVRKWQNELISYRDDDGKPFSQTYLKTVNNQLSAIMNYAVSHYRLPVNPCKAAGSMGKSKADEMNIWTQAEYEKFSSAINKSSMKLAFDILFIPVCVPESFWLSLQQTFFHPSESISIRIMQKSRVRSYSLNRRHQKQSDVFPFRTSYITISRNTFQSSMVLEMATGYFTSRRQLSKKK